MTIQAEVSAKGLEFMSCRNVLWYLVFCGFGISYMLRLNLSLAIVGMVIPRPQAAAAAQCTDDVQLASNFSNLGANASSVTNIEKHNVAYISGSPLELTRPDNATSHNSVWYSNRFAWNEYEQSLVLGGYFWIHWVTQLPGGMLARRYGTKFIFGWANLATALLGFLLPFCARFHLYVFVFVRVLQGFFAGVLWPSMHHMTAKWIPPHERSRFISSYLGSSVGAAITYPLCAILVDCFEWDSVFYVTSVLGIIWYIAWYYLAYDTPQEHPRISEAEKTYILNNLRGSINHASSQPVPWKSILTSGPVWITAIAQGGGNWGLFTLMSEAPSYFNYIHGWKISAIGVLSAAPHVIRMLFSYVFSSFADWLLRSKWMSTTNLRKFAMFVCTIIQGILLLGLAFSGCHPISAIVFMIAGTAASGTIPAGTLSSCIDLSPNYASVILGICNIATVSGGFVSPLIVGILTNNNQTIEQWQLVFIIAAAIMFITGTLYTFFGTSDLQPWNDIQTGEKGEELQKLRSKLCEVEYDKTGVVIAGKPNNYTSPAEKTGNCSCRN